MKSAFFAITLAAAFALAYIERTPEPVEEKVAPTRWGCSPNQHRCYWEYKPEVQQEQPKVALYKWGCRPICYKPDHV